MWVKISTRTAPEEFDEKAASRAAPHEKRTNVDIKLQAIDVVLGGFFLLGPIIDILTADSRSNTMQKMRLSAGNFS